MVAFAGGLMGHCYFGSGFHDKMDATYCMPHLAWCPRIWVLPGMHIPSELLVLPLPSSKEIQRILSAGLTGFRLLKHFGLGSESDERRWRPRRLALDLHHARHHHHLPRPDGLHLHRRLPRPEHAAPIIHPSPISHSRRSRNHQSSHRPRQRRCRR
jgi:hypothetical protein